jgi:hypothetical protein
MPIVPGDPSSQESQEEEKKPYVPLAVPAVEETLDSYYPPKTIEEQFPSIGKPPKPPPLIPVLPDSQAVGTFDEWAAAGQALRQPQFNSLTILRMQDGKPIPPATAARIKHVQNVLRLPSDVVSGSLEALEKVANNPSIDPVEFRKGNPLLYDILSRDRYLAAMVPVEELSKLKKLEVIFDRPPSLWPRTTEALVKDSIDLATEDVFGVNFVGQISKEDERRRDTLAGELLKTQRKFEDNLTKLGKIGLVENTADKFSENIFRLLPFINGIIPAATASALYDAAIAIQSNTATAKQKLLINNYERLGEVHSLRGGTTMGADVVDGILNLVPYGLEFAMTAGWYSAVKASTLGVLRSSYTLGRAGTALPIINEIASAKVRNNLARMGSTAIASALTPTIQVASHVGQYYRDMTPATTVILQEDGSFSYSTVPNSARFSNPDDSAYYAMLNQFTGNLAERSGASLAVMASAFKPMIPMMKVWSKIGRVGFGNKVTDYLERAAIQSLPAELYENEVEKLFNAVSGYEPYRVPTTQQFFTDLLVLGAPSLLRLGAGLISGDGSVSNKDHFSALKKDAAAKVIDSKKRESALKGLGEAVNNTTVGKLSPNSLGQMVEQFSGARDKIYVTKEQWLAHYSESQDENGSQVDPREFYRQVGGDVTAYNVAKPSEYIAIPIKGYTEHIAKNDKSNTYFSAIYKFDPENDLTVKESEFRAKIISRRADDFLKAQAQQVELDEMTDDQIIELYVDEDEEQVEQEPEKAPAASNVAPAQVPPTQEPGAVVHPLPTPIPPPNPLAQLDAPAPTPQIPTRATAAEASDAGRTVSVQSPAPKKRERVAITVGELRARVNEATKNIVKMLKESKLAPFQPHEDIIAIAEDVGKAFKRFAFGLAVKANISPEEVAEWFALRIQTVKELQEQGLAINDHRNDLSPEALFRFVKDSVHQEIVYHVSRTGEKFEEIDFGKTTLGLHVSTSAESAAVRSEIPSEHGHSTYPFWVRIRKPLRLEDRGSWYGPAFLIQLENAKVITHSEAVEFDRYSKVLDAMVQAAITSKIPAEFNEDRDLFIRTRQKDFNVLYSRYVAGLLMEKGYDSIVYLNRFEIPQTKKLSPSYIDSLTDKEFKDQYPQAAESFIVLHQGQLKSAISNSGNYDFRLSKFYEQTSEIEEDPDDSVLGEYLEWEDLPPEEASALLLSLNTQSIYELWQRQKLTQDQFIKLDEFVRKGQRDLMMDLLELETAENPAKRDAILRKFQASISKDMSESGVEARAFAGVVLNKTVWNQIGKLIHRKSYSYFRRKDIRPKLAGTKITNQNSVPTPMWRLEVIPTNRVKSARKSNSLLKIEQTAEGTILSDKATAENEEWKAERRRIFEDQVRSPFYLFIQSREDLKNATPSKQLAAFEAEHPDLASDELEDIPILRPGEEGFEEQEREINEALGIPWWKITGTTIPEGSKYGDKVLYPDDEGFAAQQKELRERFGPATIEKADYKRKIELLSNWKWYEDFPNSRLRWEVYKERQSKLHSAFLSVKNPVYFDTLDAFLKETRKETAANKIAAWIERVKAVGHDGLVIRGKNKDGTFKTENKMYRVMLFEDNQPIKIPKKYSDISKALEERMMESLEAAEQRRKNILLTSQLGKVEEDITALEKQTAGAEKTPEELANDAITTGKDINPDPDKVGDVLEQAISEEIEDSGLWQNTDDSIIPKNPSRSRRGAYWREGNSGVVALMAGKANASTVIHEIFGHFALDIMIDLSNREESSDELKADVDLIFKFLGVDRVVWAGMDFEERRPLHEKWAKAMEAYFLEGAVVAEPTGAGEVAFKGKFPSLGLLGVFIRIANRIKQIYKTTDQLVPLTPDIRSVISRMFATTDEIERMMENQDSISFFQDAKRIGMTDADAVRHMVLRNDGRHGIHMEISKTVESQLIAESLKKKSELSNKIRLRVEREVRLDRGHRLLAFLQSETDTDGAPFVGPILKLSRQVVNRHFPKFKDILPPRTAVSKGGISPNEMAALFGFHSGTEMLNALVEAESDLNSTIQAVDPNGGDAIEARRQLRIKELSEDIASLQQKQNRTTLKFREILDRKVRAINVQQVDAKISNKEAEAQKEKAREEYLAAEKRIAETPEYQGWTNEIRLDKNEIKTLKYRNRILSKESTEVFKRRRAQFIDALVERQMQMIADPMADVNLQKALREKVQEAIDKLDRTQMMTIELNFMLKKRAEVQRRLGINVTKFNRVEALSNEADNAIRKTRFSSIEIRSWKAALTLATNKMNRALIKGDWDMAIEMQELRISYTERIRLASVFKENYRKTVVKFKKIFRNEKAAAEIYGKNGMNFIYAAKALMNAYGLTEDSKIDPDKAIRLISEVDPSFYSQIQDQLSAIKNNAAQAQKIAQKDKPAIRGETVGNIYDLFEQLETLKQMAIDAGKVATLEGEKKIEDIIENQLKPDFAKFPNKAIGKEGSASQKDIEWSYFKAIKAYFRRVEHWAEAISSRFRRLIFDPISNAANLLRHAKSDVEKFIVEASLPLKNKLDASAIIANEFDGVEKKNYTFGNGAFDLIGFALHMGSESGRQRIVRSLNRLGYNAGEEILDEDGKKTGLVDDSKLFAFMDRVAREGVWTKEMQDLVTKIHDKYEFYLPIFQQAYRDRYGHYFAPLKFKPYRTPFGMSKGGYYPITPDRFSQNQELAAKEAVLDIEGRGFDDLWPTPASSMAKERSEKSSMPIMWDIRSTILTGFDRVLRFTYMANPANDVMKIINDERSRALIEGYDPMAVDKFLIPWLKRSVQQLIMQPSKNRKADSIMRILRKRTGLGLMFMNVVNAVQQFSSVTAAASKVSPKYLFRTTYALVTNPKMLFDQAKLSTLMFNRLTNEMANTYGAIDNLLLETNQLGKIDSWFERHTYILQHLAQNQIDVVVWNAARDQALDKGFDDIAAMREADSVVRQTQGSSFAEDLSQYEAGPAWARLLVMFSTFWNTQLNLGVTEARNAFRDFNGIGVPARLLFIYLMNLAIPAIIGKSLYLLASGKPDDDDDLTDVALDALFFSQLQYPVASLPMGGLALSIAINRFDSDRYNDKMSISPVLSVLEKFGRLPDDLKEFVKTGEFTKTAVGDSATALTILTGIPFDAISRPIGYVINKAKGETSGSQVLGEGLVRDVVGYTSGK